MAITYIPAIVTETSITLMIDGQSQAITDSHPNYTKIREALREGNYDIIPGLVDVAKSINTFGQGFVTVDNGIVNYRGQPLHNSLTRRILSMMAEGFNVQPMIMFLENLMENPSKRAVDELYGFLEKNSLPITEDGHLLAYKRVRPDYTDIHSGTISNHIGAKPSMPRNQVDDDKDRTCSEGLHFCSQDYLPKFSSYDPKNDHIMIVKVNPRDVVSIPSDHNHAKARCCLYEVIGEVPLEDAHEAFKQSVYPSTYVGDFEGDEVSLNEEGGDEEPWDFGSDWGHFDDDPGLDGPWDGDEIQGRADPNDTSPNTDDDMLYLTRDDAARRLNITKDALRKRIYRGTVSTVYDADGVEWVVLPKDTTH